MIQKESKKGDIFVYVRARNFNVFFHREAERSLYRLPKSVLSSVYDTISDLEVDPIPWRRWDVKPLKVGGVCIVLGWVSIVLFIVFILIRGR